MLLLPFDLEAEADGDAVGAVDVDHLAGDAAAAGDGDGVIVFDVAILEEIAGGDAARSGVVDAGLMMGLGGVLDVYAGNVKRAPKLFQRLGLEWLYRAITQPSRFKRILKLPVFLFAAVRERGREKK